MTADMNPMTTTENPDDTLCHYGKKDMKWGQRLYQNLDGSLTPLGRLHYGIGFKNIGQVEAARRAKAKAEKEKEENERIKREESRQREVEKVTRSGDANAIYALRESMTDQELTRAVNRMNATRQLESALKSVENKKIPDSVKPQKLSIFEQAKAKKEAKAQKEAAEKAEKERKAKEALDKGLQVLDTATKVANSLSGAYVTYNKTASMINEIGGDKLPQQLPTFNIAPWGKPNSGQTKKDTGTTDSKTETPAKTEKSNVSKKETTSSSSDDAYKSLMSVLDSSYGNLMGDSGSSIGSSKLSSMSKAESDKAYKECMKMLDSYGSTKVPDDPYDMLMDMMRHSEDNDNVLCHYGRKDQKWGIRRYQNLDGSLTEAGRLRYSKARKRYHMDDGGLSDRKRAKQLELAADMLRSNGKALSGLHHPSDNDIRKAIENSVNPLYNARTAAAAYGGAIVGGPIGAAIAGAVRANTVQADVANKMVIGREVLDKYMADPKYYSESIWAVPTIDFKYINENRDLMETLSKTEKKAIIHKEDNYMDWMIVDNGGDVLCHYGRMGQKWGIRRYQNLDGSLTEAGRLRYSKARDRYGMDIEDRSKLTKRQQKMQSDAGVAYLTLKKMYPELKTDNDIRKYAENQYKSVATIERGRTALATAFAAVGGTVLSGGNPLGGAVSAGTTFAVNAARQELTRGRRAADYANTIAIGKEVTDKFMKDTSIYLVTLPKGANNNNTDGELANRPLPIDLTPGMKWRAPKKYRK